MEELGTALQDLSSSEPQKRLAASRILERATRRGKGERVFGCRAATAVLTNALADEDPNVVQNAVIALAEISRRFFKDELAFPAIVRQMGDGGALTRLWAAHSEVAIRGVEALPDVLPLARDRSAKVRAEVVRLCVGLALHSELPDSVRAELGALAEATAGDRDQQVREFAANLARALGLS